MRHFGDDALLKLELSEKHFFRTFGYNGMMKIRQSKSVLYELYKN